MSDEEYKKAEPDDIRVKIFAENGTIISTKTGLMVRIKNKQTKVCIVQHTVETVEAFVMLYKFKAMNGDCGVTIIQSCINPENTEAKFHNSYVETKQHFVELMKTSSKHGRKIIYYGARNEG